jgi:two-component sensor histidine kinase
MKQGLPAGHVALLKFMTVPVFVQNRIVGVVGLANKATDYDQNDILQVSLLMDVVWKVTERKKAEDRIKSLLEEKELLLREVHHRVKNNLHVILGLIALQADSVRDPGTLAALRETGSRVRSLTVLYEKLYATSSFSSVSTGAYLPVLVDEILENFPVSASLAVEKRIDDFSLGIDKIQPLGILLNELLTNIMKYAFAGRAEGRIAVRATVSGPMVTVVVEDDGIGLPDSVDFGNSPGFGLTLVRELARQLDGSIRLERGSGTRVILEFRI